MHNIYVLKKMKKNKKKEIRYGHIHPELFALLDEFAISVLIHKPNNKFG